MDKEACKPPKDRPELREEILTILGYKSDLLGWFVYPDGYTRKGLPPEIDQILALIPDELPKDKPPFLSEVVRKERTKNITGAPYLTVLENVNWLVQAQREADIKHYGGE